MDGVESPWIEDGAEVSDAMVVVAAPTIGFVGPITAQFLVRQLDMDRVGGMIPDRLPPVARVGDDGPSLPVAIHARSTPCGPRRRCDQLVVIETELFLDIQTQHELSQTLVQWGKDRGVEAFVSPDGFFVPGEVDVGLRGTASSPEAVENLESRGVEIMDGGHLVGLSAALLCYSEVQDLDTYCLLAASNPSYPDARAASRIVKILDRFVPEVEIETEPLLREAASIEEHVRREAERLRQSHDLPREDEMMFS